MKLRPLGLVLLLLGCLAAPSAASAAGTDLGITIAERNDPVHYGNQIRYTLTVKNNGPVTDDAVVTMAVPANTSFSAVTPSKGSCTRPDPASVRCDLGTLTATGAASSASIVLFLNAEALGQVTFSAGVAGLGVDPNPGNDSDTETTTISARPNALSVTVTDSPDPATSGQTITYTATVKNNDTITIPGVRLQWTAPDGTGSTADLGDLAPQQTKTVTLQAPAGAVGSYTASASVTSPVLAGAVSDSETTKVAGPPADVAVSISGTPDPALENGTITYTVSAANQGPNAAEQVIVTAVLPAGMTLEQAEGCDTTGQTVSCALGTVGANATASATIRANAAVAGTYRVDASVDSAATETNEQKANNAASTATTVVERIADLSVSIADPGPVLINSGFELRFVVSNPSVAPAETVRLDITIPAGVALVSTTGRAACGIVGSVLSCVLERVPGGGNPAVLLKLKAPGTARALPWSATVTSPTKDPNGENNTARSTVNIVTQLPTTPADPDPPADPDEPNVPRLDLTASLVAKTMKLAKGIKVALDASRRASVRLALAVKQKGGALTLATKTVQVTGERRATLKLSKPARRAIARLKRGTKLVLTVTARPASGRAVTEKLTLRVVKGGRLKAA